MQSEKLWIERSKSFPINMNQILVTLSLCRNVIYNQQIILFLIEHICNYFAHSHVTYDHQTLL